MTKADLVMANLHHDLLEFLFQSPDFWQARWYIVSGFFSARDEQLLKALPEKKLHFVSRHCMEKWGLWVLENEEYFHEMVA